MRTTEPFVSTEEVFEQLVYREILRTARLALGVE